MSTPSLDQEDTGILAEVPEEERLDLDEGPGANALDGGADDDLDDVYANPGEVVLGDGEGKS